MSNLGNKIQYSDTLVGRRVKITCRKRWTGVFTVVQSYHVTDERVNVIVRHQKYGLNVFTPEEYELLPLTKLEKALK